MLNIKNKKSKMRNKEQMNTENGNEKNWRFNRQVNLSVLVQLIFLAALIVGSWVNLQRQLDLLQKDVTLLVDCQKKFEQRIELLQARSIAFEYRIRAIEKAVSQNEVFEDLER